MSEVPLYDPAVWPGGLPRAFGSRGVCCFNAASIVMHLMQGKDGLNARLESNKEVEEDLMKSKDGPHCEGLVSKPPLLLQRDWYLTAVQPAPAPHLAHPEGCAAPRIVLVTVPRVSRSCEHFFDGFDLHLPASSL